MRISDIINSEEGLFKFYEIMKDADDEGQIETVIFDDYIDSLDNHKILVKFLIGKALYLTENKIFDYTDKEISQIYSVDRKELVKMLTNPSLDGVCYEIFNKHIERISSNLMYDWT